MKLKVLLPLIILFFASSVFYSQYKIEPLKGKTKSSAEWVKYKKSNAILIEYSYQEDDPPRGYKGEYIIFRISNLSNTKKTISWDFTATYENEKCFNCNSDNPELHFEANIPGNSYLVGNVNNYQKGPIVIFHYFTDDDYKGKNILKWKTFNLDNLIVK